MHATFKNINYGSITAGGDVHIGDKYYVMDRDFAHSILFLRIDKSEANYQVMLSVKGPDEGSVPLLKEQTTIAIDSSLFKLVDRLQRHRRGGEAMRIAGAFQDSPQALEHSLPMAIYQSFLSGDIGQVCTDFLSLLQSGKIRDLLLVISTEEEAVQNLPWEMVLPLLTVGGNDALPRDNFGLVRSREKTVQAFNRQGPTADAAPIKLLFIPALPENLSERGKMLELENEQKKIIDAVRHLEATGSDKPRLVMEILDCANLEEIKAAIAARSHDIVHISGHGQFVETDRKGILVMEDEEGNQQEVTGYELGEALKAFSSIKLLVLSACETAVGGGGGSTAEQMAAVGLPAVLAMRFSVTDAGARLFTEKFYERLAYGDPLSKAMHDARLELWQDVHQRRVNAPQMEIPAEWFTPVLYQNQVIGPLIKPDQYTLDTLNRFYPKPDFLRRIDSRLIGEGFIGRKRLLIQLRQHLRHGRHVCLHGLGGLGKTTTAEAFAHHYRQRYGYEVLLFSRGANIQEAIMLEKIYTRWRSRTQPDEDVAAELKSVLDNPNTEMEQKLQLVLGNCLTGRRTILVLDNFEDVQTTADGVQQQAIVSDSLRAFIRYLLENSPPDCHVLFTTRYAITGLEGLLTHLELDKLSYAEQYRYLNFSLVLRRIPLAERDILHQRFDGHPRALQFLEGLLTKAPETDLPTLVQQAEGQIFENLLLERIYDRLTEEEREVFAVASVFFSRSSLAALRAVLPHESTDLAPVLAALRDWSLCFWDETDKVFEVHMLTREWMRRQGLPELDRLKALSQKLGEYYIGQPTWEDIILAKDYFEQAANWEGFSKTAFMLGDHFRLIGLYSLVVDLNKNILTRNISPNINGIAKNALGMVHSHWGQYEQALSYFDQALTLFQVINERSSEGIVFNNIGLVYTNQGEYEQALSYFEQSLAIARQVGDLSSEGTVLSNVGMICSNRGEYEQALSYFEQSLTIARQVGDLSSEGITLSNIGLIYTNQGEYEQALSYFEQSLAIARQVGDLSSEGTTLGNIGLIYSNRGEYERALDYFDRSLAIARQIGNRSGEGMTLCNLGEICRNRGEYEQALGYFDQSLFITRQIGNRSGEGTMLGSIGLIHNSQGEYDQALNYFDQSLFIARQIGNRSSEGTTLNNIGLAYSNQGKYEPALSYFEQSLAIFQQIGNRSSEGTTLNNIGLAYSNQGEYEQALSYFDQSLAIARQIGNRSGEGTTLNNIGLVYTNQGEYEQALSYFEQSLAIARQVGDLSSEGTVLSNVGMICSNRGEYEQALSYFEQSLTIARQVGDLSSEGITLSNIGLIYTNQGEYEQALSYFEQSLAIIQQIGNRSGEGTVLSNIGLIYSNRGEYERALDYFDRSLAIARQIGNRSGEGTVLNNTGMIYSNRGEYERALDYFDRSLAIARQIGERERQATVLNNLGFIHFEYYRNIEAAILLFSWAYDLFKEMNSPEANTPKTYLNKIFEQIGEERFNQIIQSSETNS